MKRWIKDPDARKDYTLDLIDVLAETDTLVSYEIVPDSGITVDLHVRNGDKITVWVNGGTKGVTYNVTFRCVIQRGPEQLQDDFTILIICDDT